MAGQTLVLCEEERSDSWRGGEILLYLSASRPLEAPAVHHRTVYRSLSLSLHTSSLSTASTFHHVFFLSDTFFPSISEYIVTSGCECALSTCCSLDRCFLPPSLFLSSSLSLFSASRMLQLSISPQQAQAVFPV